MFNWFTKKKTDEVNPLVPEIATLKTSVDKTNEILGYQAKRFEDFVTKLELHFKNIETKAVDNNNWMKEFNRLVLNDYVSGPRSRVYAFLYAMPHRGEHKMILVARDRFEEAQQTSSEVMLNQGMNMREWVLENYQSLDIPMAGSQEGVKKINDLSEPTRPIQSYLNELQLLRDRFCETATEKKTVDGLIRKISIKYNVLL